MSDAGTSLVSCLGFKIAKYGGGNTHLFGHGRIEWIMGIFTSIAVLLMGIKLAEDSAASIANPDSPVFSMPALVVLLISILVKVYMYCYKKRADCIRKTLMQLAPLSEGLFLLDDETIRIRSEGTSPLSML